jgi:hypothetical protein
MVMRGTERRTFAQIYEEIEAVGATVDVSSGINVTSFGAKSLTEDLPLIVDAGRVLQHPLFQLEVERAKFRLICMNALTIHAACPPTFRELLIQPNIPITAACRVAKPCPSPRQLVSTTDPVARGVDRFDRWRGESCGGAAHLGGSVWRVGAAGRTRAPPSALRLFERR